MKLSSPSAFRQRRLLSPGPKVEPRSRRLCRTALLAISLAACAASPNETAPRVVLISLDGATPRLVEEFRADGTIPAGEGLALLATHGVQAEQNITANPSLTAPGHIAIATGSTAARNDTPANTFHLVASPFATNVSGFSAPIGGYSFDGPNESGAPTAEPLWVALRAAGKRVATATWPGGDGLDIRVPGLQESPIIQSADKRTVDYVVPFGTFGGAGARGFVLNGASFGAAPAATVSQLTAARRMFFGSVLQTLQPLETLTISGSSYAIQVVALDTTDDAQQNYDTLVFFDANRGIESGPFTPPATGPAYVTASKRRSSRFFFEGSTNKAGAAFYVSQLAPDLSLVHVARYAANFIPRNPPVVADVDDINSTVGFWAAQPDFRIPERLSPGFDAFNDLELEAIYQDQVVTFVDYQLRVGLRAIEHNPDADLVMIYIEQPDGASHQFLLTDPRQPSDPRDPNSIGANQDLAKRERYRAYLGHAYRIANEAVQRIIEATGIDQAGRPAANVIVASDHGIAPFHTAVNLNPYLASRGFDPKQVRAVTSGPAANIYINLQGREPDGTVSRTEYLALQKEIAKTLTELEDSNPNYVLKGRKLFDQIAARPTRGIDDPEFGLGGNRLIGQDSGDVYAVLALGYNFDGMQSPVVPRLGDDPATAQILSVPNFYGAHGYDPELDEMSAIFFAAGPDVCPGRLKRVRNIDIAPTILQLLEVRPAETVQGRAIELCGKPTIRLIGRAF